MGVDIYLLNRGNAILEIGGVTKKIGKLGRLCKTSELNAWRAKQMDECHDAVQGKPAPVAVLAWPAGVYRPDAPNKQIEARVVLAWEPNRSTVTDWNTECLPELGYAVINYNLGRFVLHEQLDGFVVPISRKNAEMMGILDRRGKSIRKLVPRIVSCEAVEVRKLSKFVIAKCVLENGKRHDVWTSVEQGNIPDKDWYIGKKPAEADLFCGA